MSVKIYTKTTCGYCTAAKNLLDMKNISYEEISLDNEQILKEFKEQYPDVRTVPQIFINNQRIGGYQELTQYDLSTI